MFLFMNQQLNVIINLEDSSDSEAEVKESSSDDTEEAAPVRMQEDSSEKEVTASTKRKLTLGINEDLVKPVAVELVEVSSGEDSGEDSSEDSSEDSGEEEVEIVLEKSTAGSVSKEKEGSSSDSSGKIILARARELLHTYRFYLEGSSSNQESNEASKEKILGANMKLSKKNPKKGSKSGVIDQVISRKSSTRNPFTPEEDQILLEAMRSGEKVDCTKLAKKMNRNSGSVLTRVRKLELSGGVPTTGHSLFTLEEDLTIIESVLQNVQQFSKLDDMSLSFEESTDLAASLGRNRVSITERWKSILKAWIKGYYTGTLNMEIRVQLAEVLAKNFENIESGKPSK